MSTPFSRRDLIAGLAASAALSSTLVRTASAARKRQRPAPPPPPVVDAPTLLDQIAWQLLELSPGSATGLGVDTGPHAALRGKLDDRSFAGVEKQRRFLAGALQRLGALKRDGLDVSTLTSVEVVESAFRTALEGMNLPYGDATIGSWRNTPYVVIQNVGGYLDIPSMLDGDQPVRDKADAEAWLARLAAFPALLDGELERLRDARGKGLVPPDFLLDKTISALTRTISDATSVRGPMVNGLVQKTREAKIAGDWQQAALSIIGAEALPALERQLAEIRLQRAVATSDAGMRERPHGAEWYAWGLRASTTTRRSPEDLHAMGMAQLADLNVRMDAILKSQGLTQGTVGARAIELQKRAELNFPTNDDGRAQIIAYMQGKLDAMRTRLPQAFRTLTRGNFEIKRMPLAQEPGAPTAYGGPGSIDGLIPGKIWVNLGDTLMHNKVTIPDLVFHEGIPGHVWQGEYAQKLPLIRSMLAFNAYSEGWALYAEQLADELGMYEGDPYGELGFLMGLSWRAVRLVVDTGIHAMGWSRERALQAFIDATGLPLTNAVSEVERYCAWPGQACGYKVGHTEIVRLRASAQQALGAKYDLRDFNQAVVDGGNVPLDVLAANVARYIKSLQV